MRIKGTKFLITGGTAGIGQELALGLARAGADVVICGRNTERIEELEAQTPRIVGLRCDVRDEPGVLAMRDAALAIFGPPDVLINNAAVFKRFDLTDPAVGIQDWIDELDTNLLGALRVTHAMLPLLIDRGQGTVVNVTSPSAFIPLANAPIYSASKAALQSFTISLRHQLRNTGIAVIELNPPAVDTQMNQDNPDVEGLKLWSVSRFSAHVIERLRQNNGQDILVGDAKLVSRMRRIAPNFVFKKMNPNDTPRSRTGAV